MRQVRLRERKRDFYAPELDDERIDFAQINPQTVSDWSSLKDGLREVPMTPEVARLVWPHCQKVLIPETSQEILTKVLWIVHQILSDSGSSVEYHDPRLLAIISFVIENSSDNHRLFRETLSLLELITRTFIDVITPKSTIERLLEMTKDPPEWIRDRCNIMIYIICQQITRFTDNASVCIEMMNLGTLVVSSQDIDASKAAIDGMIHILESGAIRDWMLSHETMGVLMSILDSGNASLASSLVGFLKAYVSLGDAQSANVIETGCIPHIINHPLALYPNVQRGLTLMLQRVASVSPQAAAYIVSVVDVHAFLDGPFDVQKNTLMIIYHAMRYGVFEMDDELKSFAHMFVESDDIEALRAILQMIAEGAIPFERSYSGSIEELTTHQDETIAMLSAQILT